MTPVRMRSSNGVVPTSAGTAPSGVISPIAVKIIASPLLAEPPGSPAADEFQHAPAHAPMAEIGGSDSPISAPSAVAARPGGTQTTIRIAVGSQGMKVYLLFVDTRCTSTKGIACPTST